MFVDLLLQVVRRSAGVRALVRDDSNALPNITLRESRISAMRKLPVVHISSCAVGQITTILSRVPHPHEGRFAIVTDVGSGMRWTR